WKERQLFEYWAHAASIVLTEDYPLHAHRMSKYSTAESPWSWSGTIRSWVEQNIALHDHILDEISRKGPMLSRQFESHARAEWASSGWTNGRNISQMLDYLWVKGVLMVAGRAGGQKLWDLSERCLPEWTPRDNLTGSEVVSRTAQRSLRA